TMFTFVVPEAMFDPEDPFRIYDEERQQALIVYFDLGKYDINPEFRDNRQTLINLTAVTEMILGDPHSRVERVVVAGFASPEGTFRFNDILSFRRAAAIKHYLLQTTGLRDEQVWTYNGSVDWRGLRLLVEQSDMPQKERILRLLESTSDEAQRLERLKQLDDGAPYRYLFDEVFPLLRNGAFIKVYYSNNPKE
ncbi:OmpA family protein, partial [Alistipes sp. OttesenSCG-928-L06]|nr:OmpA family protein [Alistipes sp. OttesenSCG-928-L06]